MDKLTGWLQRKYRQIVNSIAFYPALIAFMFLGLSYVLIRFDFSEAGKHFKSQLEWLRLKDATTARSIISSIVSGVISLAVFSFSMVMIILNQTASQMSNRILDKLIGNRFQQIVLGFYIGTIVFALFLLSTIRDIDSGIYVPAISIYILIILTVADIFLFIYFLHYVTQSVKYKVIIHRIYRDTQKVMEEICTETEEADNGFIMQGCEISPAQAGIYEGFNTSALLKICRENDCILQFIRTPGSFLWVDMTLMRVSKELSKKAKEKICDALIISTGEEIENNFLYGFQQLGEVAMKALSPGINDPGTAIQSLRAYARLFAYRMSHFPRTKIFDKDGTVRILMQQLTFEETFEKNVLPVWDYGKEDRLVQHEMENMLVAILHHKQYAVVEKLLQKVKKAIREQE